MPTFRNFLFVLFTTLCVWLVSSISVHAQPAEHDVVSSPADLFIQGNVYYGEERYADALDAYLQARASARSAALEHNLGNTYFKLGRLGEAILSYERALALNPNLADAQANLLLARRSAGIEAPAPGALDPFARTFAYRIWFWIATAAFWCALFCFVLPRFFSGPNIFTRLGWILSLIVLLTSLAGLFLWQDALNRGIVVQGNATLRLAPTSESPGEATLDAGTAVRIAEARTGYVYVTTEDGRGGYLRQDEVGRVMPGAGQR